MQPRLRYRYKTLADHWLKLRQGGVNDTVTDSSAIYVNGDAKVLKLDQEAVNGVIHVVDKVLMCPCLSQSPRRRGYK